ncbi:hypothetical protein Tcan_07896 [Toxocara canis]|uniref:Uncharacterized protein n=1 Tax=Toxocara canis TaxID=6265 RepID=A0A0B2W5U3_TOXCA|nr:hypothetical protein Tcan_07896 [Toxocara canis]
MWTVLLFCLVHVAAHEKRVGIVHEISSKVDIGMALNSSITCEDKTGKVYPLYGVGYRACFELSNCFPVFEKIKKLKGQPQEVLKYFRRMTLPTFGEDSESDSNSSLSSISSPIILEMLKLELERQKRERREESIESDEEDGRV